MAEAIFSFGYKTLHFQCLFYFKTTEKLLFKIIMMNYSTSQIKTT